MFIDRSAVRRLSRGPFPMVSSSLRKEAVASFLVVDGNDKGNAKAPKTEAKSIPQAKESDEPPPTKSPLSRASTSATVNETQSITPLSGISGNGGGGSEDYLSSAVAAPATGEEEDALPTPRRGARRAARDAEDAASAPAALGSVSKSSGSGESRGVGVGVDVDVDVDSDDGKDRGDASLVRDREAATVDSEYDYDCDYEYDYEYDDEDDVYDAHNDAFYAKLEADARASSGGVRKEPEEDRAVPRRTNARDDCDVFSNPRTADDDFVLLRVQYKDRTRLVPVVCCGNNGDVGRASEELSLLLRAVFDVSWRHDVVGLAVSGRDCPRDFGDDEEDDDGDGDDEPRIVVPLSAIVSGRFLGERSGSVHGFKLLTYPNSAEVEEYSRSTDSYESVGTRPIEEQSRLEVFGDESFSLDFESSGRIGAARYCRILRQLVSSNHLDFSRGHSLASFIMEHFGRDGEVVGPLRVAFVIYAEFTGRAELLSNALKSIADAITLEQFYGDKFYDDIEDVLQLSSMNHMLNAAEFLYWSSDLSIPAYVTLCQRILESETEVSSIFHNYRIDLEADLDQGIGDSLVGLGGTPSTRSLENLLSALKLFVKSLELLDIYPDVFSTEEDLNAYDISDETSQKSHGSQLKEESVASMLEDVPNTLLDAVTTLVEHGRISKDAAAALSASYALGNEAVKTCHESFVETGNVPVFLKSLEGLVSEEESVASAFNEVDEENTEPKFAEEACRSQNKRNKDSAYELLMRVFRDFDETQIAALRLAVARNDSLLRCALRNFNDSRDIGQFRQALEDIAELTAEDAKYKFLQKYERRGCNEQFYNERRYGLRIMIAYLVETGAMKSVRGVSLLQRYDDGDVAVHDALRLYESSNDASSFVVRLQSI